MPVRYFDADQCAGRDPVVSKDEAAPSEARLPELDLGAASPPGVGGPSFPARALLVGIVDGQQSREKVTPALDR
jgi:hypothetical protein